MNTNRNELHPAKINWNRIVDNIQKEAVEKMKLKWAYIPDSTSHSEKTELFVISFNKTEKFVHFLG